MNEHVFSTFSIFLTALIFNSPSVDATQEPNRILGSRACLFLLLFFVFFLKCAASFFIMLLLSISVSTDLMTCPDAYLLLLFHIGTFYDIAFLVALNLILLVSLSLSLSLSFFFSFFFSFLSFFLSFFLSSSLLSLSILLSFFFCMLSVERLLQNLVIAIMNSAYSDALTTFGDTYWAERQVFHPSISPCLFSSLCPMLALPFYLSAHFRLPQTKKLLCCLLVVEKYAVIRDDYHRDFFTRWIDKFLLCTYKIARRCFQKCGQYCRFCCPCKL